MKQAGHIYQRIDGSQWRHIWLVGDIHGCLAQLREKLWFCRFDPWQDLLISVGDVIDRGGEFALPAITGSTLGQGGKRQS